MSTHKHASFSREKILLERADSRVVDVVNLALALVRKRLSDVIGEADAQRATLDGGRLS